MDVKIKKILYVVRYPLEYTYSIMQKVNGQIQELKNMGFEVSYLCYDYKNIFLNCEGKLEKIGLTTLGKSKAYFHFISYMDLYRKARDVIENNHYDIVYIRSAPLNHYALKMFLSASCKSRVVVENPSYSKTENEKLQNVLRRIYGYYSQYLWKISSKYIDLFAIIGDYTDKYRGRPAVNINNGVSLSVIPLRKRMIPPDGKTHILAVASMCEWHGYDRLIAGFSEWNSPEKDNYIIDFVGDEGDGSLAKWKALTCNLGLQDQVIFHGRKTGIELSYYYNIATIGMSSLGFYRTGFTTGSVLKLREYMARGLPFLYAHDDPDLNEKLVWCEKIPNNSSPVNMEYIKSFIERIEGVSDISIQMRKYAAEKMTWEAQFNKVINKLMEQ